MEDVEEVEPETDDEDLDADTTDTADEQEEAAKKKSVRWSESPDAVKQFRRNDVIVDGATPNIKFSHSTDKRRPARFVDDTREEPAVSSPADIFSKFGPGGRADLARTLDEPKSILKVKKSTTPVLTDRLQEAHFEEAAPDGAGQQQQQHEQRQELVAPVGDEVKEREPNEPEHEAVNTHRPLSRFRAARQHKKL